MSRDIRGAVRSGYEGCGDEGFERREQLNPSGHRLVGCSRACRPDQILGTILTR